jgi:hypothetical protein
VTERLADDAIPDDRNLLMKAIPGYGLGWLDSLKPSDIYYQLADRD